MIGIAGYVSRVAIVDFARSVREAVPDRFAFAIFFPRTFDLVCGGGRAPKKILGKFYFRGVVELVTRARKPHNARRVRGIRRHTAGRKQPGRERGGHACGKSRTRKFTAGGGEGGRGSPMKGKGGGVNL